MRAPYRSTPWSASSPSARAGGRRRTTRVLRRLPAEHGASGPDLRLHPPENGRPRVVPELEGRRRARVRGLVAARARDGRLRGIGPAVLDGCGARVDARDRIRADERDRERAVVPAASRSGCRSGRASTLGAVASYLIVDTTRFPCSPRGRCSCPRRTRLPCPARRRSPTSRRRRPRFRHRPRTRPRPVGCTSRCCPVPARQTTTHPAASRRAAR